jgi:hypothetical protein
MSTGQLTALQTHCTVNPTKEHGLHRSHSKFEICRRCRWANLPTVTTTPAVLVALVANLPTVSLIPVMHLDLRISPRIFGKIRNGPNVIFRGLEEIIYEKRSKKCRDTVPLKPFKTMSSCAGLARYTLHI